MACVEHNVYAILVSLGGEKIMPTSKPYWDDPLQRQFEVRVTSCVENADGYLIGINRDVIRPEGGGQAGDRGILNCVRIKNTISVNEHTQLLTDEQIPIGSQGILSIDMDWRHAIMRNHTAEHIFVSQLKRINRDIELGYIWIDGHQGTIDIAARSLSIDQVLEAEEHVQQIIFDELPVQSTVIQATGMPDQVRAREGITSKHDQLRIVSIHGVDEAACSGVHVQNTRDIAFFKITDVKPAGDTTRIRFLTHEKAMAQTSSIFNHVLKRKTTFPYEIDQIGAVLDQAKRINSEREEIARLIAELLGESRQSENIQGVEFKHQYLPGFEASELREMLKSLPLHGKMAILLFSSGEKCNFVFWTSELNSDAAFYVKETVESLGGKGGGNRDSFTGGFTSSNQPREIYLELVEGIREKLGSD
jgi:alanyl-tRNA synthetase